MTTTTRIGINGFGRIGRQVLRAVRQRDRDDELEIVAINDLADPETLAYLLRHDSVHGRYPGTVEAAPGSLVVDGRRIALSSAAAPSSIPWADHGVRVVLESTGRFVDGKAAAAHLDAGAQRVLISAPGKGPIDGTFVLGVSDGLDPSWQVISNASCTTNCAALLVRGINDLAGIRRAAITVIHAYTNDQSLHDQPHRELRRARAAAVSLIPASTGSSSDIVKVIPELRGRLSSVAVRTPNIDGSMVDLVCEVETPTDRTAVNEAFEAMAARLPGVVACTDEPLVSADIVGNAASVIVDTSLTTVVDGTLVQVMGWFDNEWGYANRCAEVLAMLRAN